LGAHTAGGFRAAANDTQLLLPFPLQRSRAANHVSGAKANVAGIYNRATCPSENLALEPWGSASLALSALHRPLNSAEVISKRMHKTAEASCCLLMGRYHAHEDTRGAVGTANRAQTSGHPNRSRRLRRGRLALHYRLRAEIPPMGRKLIPNLIPRLSLSSRADAPWL
jgi:hypothetical protein